MKTRFIYSDAAENSIMQTITIAVSTILLASGLTTAPGLINNSRDTNARADLDNISYAQDTALGEAGKYFELDDNGQPADPETPDSVEYSLSGGTENHLALVCDEPSPSYLLRVTSTSGTTFYRMSGGTETTTDLSTLDLPDCIEERAAVYNASGTSTPLVLAGGASAPSTPPPAAAPPAPEPTPTPTPTPDTVGNSAGLNPDGSVRPPRARR